MIPSHSLSSQGLMMITTKQHSLRHTSTPDSKVNGANMGPIWGRQDPGGPHVGPMNFAIWDEALFWTAVTKWNPELCGTYNM